MVTLLYRTLQSTLGYDTALRRTWVIYCRIAAKPLQTETRLLLTAYRNSSSSYPTAPSLTFYDVRFSQNTCVTDDDRHADRRQTNNTLCPRLVRHKKLDLGLHV